MDLNTNNIIKISRTVWPRILKHIKTGHEDFGEVRFKKLSIGGRNKNNIRPWVSIQGRGCRHQLNGGCTMCGYRLRSPEAKCDTSILKGYFSKAIEYFKEQNGGNDIYYYGIATGGSFFDPGEIAPDIRRYVYEELNKITPSNSRAYLNVESRLEYINKEILDEFKYYTKGNIKLSVGYGLESMNALVREACVNKNLPANWPDKIRLMKDMEIFVKAHIIFKPLFLSEREAVNDVIDSVLGVYGQELADQVVVMTMRIFPDTAVSYLKDRGKYSLPSIWSVLKIIESLGPKHCFNTTFNGFAWDFKQKSFTALPGFVRGCPECSDKLMPLLFNFKSPNPAQKWNELISTANSLNCRCKKDHLMKSAIEDNDKLSINKRVFNGLNDLCLSIFQKDALFLYKNEK